MASTSIGVLPTAWVASVWKMIPFSLASLPIAATSWIVPISLLANMTEIRMVLSVIALRISSTSIRPSGCTGTYVTSKPWRSSRLATSMPARCSMTVVTMWLPFSRYISATPLRARLIDSVPPEVNTSSLGSRAPMSLASLPRATSTAASASQPNGWLRLAGCPNFSVKYGSIASTTRGSHGVVDWASMKIGNFSGIRSPLCLDSQDVGHILGRQLGQGHRVQQLRDGQLELGHRPPKAAALDLRAGVVLQAGHDVDRPLERPDDLPHADLAGPAGQHIAALRPVMAHDQPLPGERLEDLRQQLLWNRELLRDTLGADGTLVMNGDVVDRHEAVIGALGEAEHSHSLQNRLRMTPTLLIGDRISRILTPDAPVVNGKGSHD